MSSDGTKVFATWDKGTSAHGRYSSDGGLNWYSGADFIKVFGPGDGSWGSMPQIHGSADGNNLSCKKISEVISSKFFKDEISYV